MKRFASLIISILLIVSIIPLGGFSVFAETPYSGSCGEKLTWSLDTETGLLAISGTGNMTDWSSYSYVPWYSYKSYVINIQIADGVTSIGDQAFAYCRNLTSITIPDSVTNIGDDAFYCCSSLASMDIPNKVIHIGDSAFAACSSLTSIKIPDGVTSIEKYVFDSCSNLTSIIIPKGVTSIGNYAFQCCKNLTSLIIPDTVTHIGQYAFRGCSNITSINIPQGVKSIGVEAFSGCSRLNAVYITDISAWVNIAFGTYVANPLYYAGKLYLNDELVTEIAIPEGVERIGDYAFNNCTSLTSIRIPDGVTSIGFCSFDGCTKLKSIAIPDSVTHMDYRAFYKCSSLTSIEIPDGITGIENETFAYCSNLTSVAIPDGVTSIGADAFSNCSNLTSVTIPDGVTSIGNSAFSKCLSLTSITIPDGVTSIDMHAFNGCRALETVAFTNSVKTIKGVAFYNCGIKDVYYYGTITTWNEINIGENNSPLTSATIHFMLTEETEEAEQSQQDKYLQQHINFVNSATFNTVSDDFRYATILWTNYHGSTSQAVGEFVYDIQEGFFETISFQGMSSLENPYDAIILDLLSSKSVNASLSDTVDSSTTFVIEGVIGDLITVFQADSDWADDIDIADNFKDLLDLEAKDYSSNKLYQSLDKLFDGKSTDQINSMFRKYDCYSNVLANVSDAAKGVDYFLELLKYTASIEAYYNASEEFKAILKEVADVMPSVNADYGQKFNETYNNYSSCIDYNSVMQNVLNHATEEGFWLLTDLMSDVLQDSALTFCKTALKMSESAAGTLVATLWAAETGFNLGNMITDNDTLVNCRRLLRANYMLDEAVHHVMCTHASNLKANPSYEEALYFDAAFNLFKNLQINSLGLHQKYMKANGSSFINFLNGKQDYFKREAEAQAAIINTWKTIECHDEDLANSIQYSKTNTVVVACPTDIFVYKKSEGVLVASVQSDVVTNIDDNITVISENGEKAICTPNINDYEIKIVATDNGKMSVYYNEHSNVDMKFEREIVFNDIQIYKQECFEMISNIEEKVVIKEIEGETILPDFDSITLRLGDVNTDEEINIMDATTIQRQLASLVELDRTAKSVADANADGDINILDATHIQRFLAQIIPSL